MSRRKFNVVVIVVAFAAAAKSSETSCWKGNKDLCFANGDYFDCVCGGNFTIEFDGNDISKFMYGKETFV